MADLLFTTDLENATREQLKALVKRVRQETGKAIDLRKADAIALRQYLQDYLIAQTEAEEATITADLEAEEDFGIAFCDGCEKRCELADPEPELEVPESFNAIASRTVDILLQFGTAYGGTVNQEWLQGILKDASWRTTIPESVSEKLLLSDPIYYGLAGIGADSIALFQRVIKTPEEFSNVPSEAKQGADFYHNMGSLIGADKVAQVVAYHTIRDNLNYLQERLGISSLEARSKAIRDKLFTYQDYDDQMALLPSDRAVLKEEAVKIAMYFLLVTDGYQLYRELDDESLEPLPEDFSLESMISQSFGCDSASISTESFEWQPYGDGFGGHLMDRLHPDKISLSLNAWDGSGYVSFMRMVGIHPDPSRRPWLADRAV